MYSKFPKVSILTSKGIEFNNDIFFVLHYRIFKKPEGIMKFPDGGLPKNLINECYIVKYDNNTKENSLIYKLNIDNRSINLETINIFENNGKIFFSVEYKIDKTKEKIQKKELYITDSETGETVIKTNSPEIVKTTNKQNVLSSRATGELVRFIYDYDKLGLKSPLDFMNLNDKNIKEVLLHDKLNGRMHIALIYYLIKNNKSELLGKIEKENTDKYINGDIKYFKDGLTTEQLKEYYKSIR
jgi:hypothetical protein